MKNRGIKPEPEQTAVERALDNEEGAEEFMRGRVWNRTTHDNRSTAYMKYVAGEITSAVQYYIEVLKNIENRERDGEEARRQATIAILSLINIIFEIHKEPRIGDKLPLIIILIMYDKLDLLGYHVKQSHNHLYPKFLQGRKAIKKLCNDI